MISTIVAVIAPVVFAVVVWLTCGTDAPKIPDEFRPALIGFGIAMLFTTPVLITGYVTGAGIERPRRVEIQNTSPEPVYVSVPKPEYLGTITIGTISTELATGTIWTSSSGPHVYIAETYASITVSSWK